MAGASSRRTIRAAVAAIALVTTFGVDLRIASAEPAAPPPSPTGERAQKLFDEGQELLRAGNVAGACAKLEKSHELEPLIGTLLNMAYCHERQGRVGLAWREYRLAASRATADGQASRAKFAATRATEIEAKLVAAKIRIPAGATLHGVKVDGDPVPGDPTVVFLERGRHVVDVKTGEGADGEKTVVVDVKTDDREVIVDATTTRPPPSPVVPMPRGDDQGAGGAAPRDGSTQRIVGWSLAGLGVVGIGLGTYFGIRTIEEKNEAESRCNGELCTAEGKRAGDRAHDLALVSTIAFGVGVVSLGAGTYLVVSAPSAVTVGGRF